MVKISPKNCTEAGIVFALLLVLGGLLTGIGFYYKLAIAAMFINLAVPKAFWPFAFCWFNLSVWLGFITSKILLSVVFILVIVPVAMLRKLGGKDRLMLKEFKKSSSTVFTERNIKFGAEHLNKTY